MLHCVLFLTISEVSVSVHHGRVDWSQAAPVLVARKQKKTCAKISFPSFSL